MDAFEEIRQHPSEPSRAQQTPPTQDAYTEQYKTSFHERAKRLSLAALESSCIMKATRSPVFEIAVPTESAEELIREALGE